MINKIVIVGIGLIGSSFALALKKSGKVNTIVGIDPCMQSIHYAIEHNIIDQFSSIESAMKNADILMLAVPVAKTSQVLTSILPYLEPTTLITDVGSTKTDVISQATFVLGDKINQFIPAHPIAGSEKTGPESASEDLFFNKNLFITPLIDNKKEDILKIQSMWEQCGAIVNYLSAKEHDSIFSQVSHLPHLLSYAFVHNLNKKDNSSTLFQYAGNGFKDFTRLAASSPGMWCDISIANKDNIIKDLDSYIQQLEELRSFLVNENTTELTKLFTNSYKARKTL